MRKDEADSINITRVLNVYDFKDFNQVVFNSPDQDPLELGRIVARQRRRTVVVEDGDDYYRVTPKGRRLRMPSWFMPSTLGGKP